MLNKTSLSYFLVYAAIVLLVTSLVPITFLITDKISHGSLEYRLKAEPPHTRH